MEVAEAIGGRKRCRHKGDSQPAADHQWIPQPGISDTFWSVRYRAVWVHSRR